MPFTVITLKNVPASLRGDLTKWMQEIDTGVYVGNFNSRIREYLWKRVCHHVGNGEATMSFSSRNELGYDFCTINSHREVIDYDGLPLVMVPHKETGKVELRKGFSDAFKRLHSKRIVKPEKKNQSTELYGNREKECDKKAYIVLDIETSGLRVEKDQIIELGAVKYENGYENEFHKLICIESVLPESIIRLTGITDQMLKDGSELKDALTAFVDFIGELDLIGYNIQFDLKFINEGLKKYGMTYIANRCVDLLKTVKSDNIFLQDYRLETVLKAYGIDEKVPHRALEDARLISRLARKVNKI